MGKLIDLTGQKFVRLTVVERGKCNKGVVYWKCRCDCGNVKVISSNALLNYNSKSCGCLQKQRASSANSTHKKTRTKIYNLYHLIKARCYKPYTNNFKDYGGRGITMCDEWLGKNGFINFYNWAINNGYKEEILHNGKNKWTIDRIDVNGNYEPKNCRFITNEEQARNKRNTVYLTYNGETLTQNEWAKKLDIYAGAIQWRLKKGWSVEEALSTPVKYGQRIKKFRKENN